MEIYVMLAEIEEENRCANKKLLVLSIYGVNILLFIFAKIFCTNTLYMIPELYKLCPLNRFCTEICYHFISWTVYELQFPFLDLIGSEGIPYMYMYCNHYFICIMLE